MYLKEKKIDEYCDWYIKERPRYKTLSERVVDIIKYGCDSKGIKYLSIEHRAKSVKSFNEKIKMDINFDPCEMQDLAGVRIIVFVDSEIRKVINLLKELFDIGDTGDKGDILGTERVGYKSVHCIGRLPEERIKLIEYDSLKDLKFEIQVRTVLQHAWAQIGHDVNYKAVNTLPEKISRRFNLLAGLLEIADNEIGSITLDIDNYTKKILEKTRAGKLDIPINSISLKEYFDDKFKDIKVIERSFGPENNRIDDIMQELNDMNIKEISDFNKIISKDYMKQIEQISIKNYLGMARDILIIHDSDRYFTKAWKNKWSVINLEAKQAFFEQFGVNFLDIVKKYNIT